MTFIFPGVACSLETVKSVAFRPLARASFAEAGRALSARSTCRRLEAATISGQSSGAVFTTPFSSNTCSSEFRSRRHNSPTRRRRVWPSSG